MGPDAEDPEYKEECVALVKTLGIEDIIFTGMVQITDYLEKMDFMLLTSISEGQPLAVMEGLAAKKAFITTNVGDCHDLLFGFDDLYGEAGIIENVMDVNGIAKSAIKLCQDKKLRVQMGINGYNRMKHLYPQDKVVESFKNLYEQFER